MRIMNRSAPFWCCFYVESWRSYDARTLPSIEIGIFPYFVTLHAKSSCHISLNFFSVAISISPGIPCVAFAFALAAATQGIPGLILRQVIYTEDRSCHIRWTVILTPFTGGRGKRTLCLHRNPLWNPYGLQLGTLHTGGDANEHDRYDCAAQLRCHAFHSWIYDWKKEITAQATKLSGYFFK